MTRILLIRHAIANTSPGELAGRRPGVGLNPRGQDQAVELVGRIRHVPLEAIYTSPLERARETAAPLARDRSLEAVTLPELQELDYGYWQGATPHSLSGDPYWETYNRARSLHRIPGGESLAEVQLRMLRTLEWLRAEHAGAGLAVISHADPIRALLAHLLGIPLDFVGRLEVRTASISLVDFPGGNPVVRCINHTGELTAFGDRATDPRSHNTEGSHEGIRARPAAQHRGRSARFR